MNTINMLETGTESLVCEITVEAGSRIPMDINAWSADMPVSVKVASMPNAFLSCESLCESLGVISNERLNIEVKGFYTLIGMSCLGVVSFESILDSFSNLRQFFSSGRNGFSWHPGASPYGVPTRVVCEQRGVGPLTPDTLTCIESPVFDVTADITFRVYVLDGIKYCDHCGKPVVASSPTGFVNYTHASGYEEPLCHECAASMDPIGLSCGYCGKIHSSHSGRGSRFNLVEIDSDSPKGYTVTERCAFCHSSRGLLYITYPVEGFARGGDVDILDDGEGGTVYVLHGHRDAGMTCPICRRTSMRLLRGGTCCTQIAELRGRGGHRTFVDYSYKPVPAFHHHDKVKTEPDIGEVYMGMELELSLTESHRSSLRSLATEVNSMDVAYCKTDSSIIGDGFEIVTHPRTLQGWKTWDEFLGFLDRMKTENIGVEGVNGIHIHVGKTAFGETGTPERLEHARQFALFWNRLSEKYPRTYYELVGRPPTSYCAPDQSVGRARPNGVDKEASLMYDRYRAVNVSPQYTIELRMFATTFDLNKLQSYLELVHASVMLTNPETEGFIPPRVLRYGKFLTKAMRFIADSGEYPHLLNRIRKNQIGGRASCV